VVERLTVRDAALRLGISAATVRRQIAAGELVAEQEARPQGMRWWVLLDTTMSVLPHADGVEEQALPGHRAAIDRALDEIAFLRRKLDEASVAQSELRRLLAMQGETLLRLQSAHHSSAQLQFTDASSAASGALGASNELREEQHGVRGDASNSDPAVIDAFNRIVPEAIGRAAQQAELKKKQRKKLVRRIARLLRG